MAQWWPLSRSTSSAAAPQTSTAYTRTLEALTNSWGAEEPPTDYDGSTSEPSSSESEGENEPSSGSSSQPCSPSTSAAYSAVLHSLAPPAQHPGRDTWVGCVASGDASTPRADTTQSRGRRVHIQRTSVLEALFLPRQTRSSALVRPRRKSTGEVVKVRSRSATTTTEPEKSAKRPPTADAHKEREKEREKDKEKDKKKSSGPFALFAPAPVPPRAPVKVECITCLADDVPVRKSAKLDCTHRICHDCLKRVFKLSVTDPQLMPPKCCSDSPIPLKHVDRLFDTPFKRTWNKKFAEYTTKNRLYCPTKHCGEWIKPKHISHDRATRRGRGTCPKCRRDVCKPCGQKWHGARDCTADPATLRVLEIGREHGWQRCYNCKALVQLAEGCNHMKCRCAAEFCMLCGLQWKSCDCPWFNLPEDNEGDNGGPQPAPPAPPAPPRPQRERAPGAPLGPLDVPDIWRPFEMLRPRARWAQMGAANAPDPAAAQRDDEALARQVQAMEIGAEVTGAEAEALTLGDEAARRRRRRARTRRNAENDLAELMGGDGGSPSGERSKRRPVSSRSNGEATQHRRRR